MPATPTAYGRASLAPAQWVVAPPGHALLTLSGRPSPTELVEALKLLDEKDARASFFLPAAWVAEHKTLTKLILSQGHDIGNGGFKATSTGPGIRGLRASIARADRVLTKLGFHPRPFLQVPSGGAPTPKMLEVAARMGYRSVRATDRTPRGRASTIVDRVAKDAGDGSIISLNLGKTSEREALDGIIGVLRSKGLDLASLDALKNVDPVRWDVTLELGSSGPEVRSLQKTLQKLSYDPGGVDGVFSEATLQAVYAFEKTYGLERDGAVPPSQMEQIVTSERSEATDKQVSDFVDIDISRQVLFEVRDGTVVHTLPISSAIGELYTVDGETSKAKTPTGAFEVLWKIPGWRVSDLGELYYPSYFHSAGYAIHGSPLVPTYPASHGCIHIPMHSAKSFYERNPTGTKVFVHA